MFLSFCKSRADVMRGLGIAVLGGAIVGLAACQSASDIVWTTPMDQELFRTPEMAADALAEATRRDDTVELKKILGARGDSLIHSGDPVADKNGREKFVAAYDAHHQLEPTVADMETLVVGSEEWPLSIPLVRQDGAWRFDTAAGAQEILNRRIGRNELSVMGVCRAYVVAQREFSERRVHHHRHAEFAQKFMSAPRRHDGLYWPVKAGEKESPLGPLMAQAQAEGYRQAQGNHRPYHGYYFQILKRQGAEAAGGAKDYVVKGRMTRGFALIAFPATYGDSGVMTFIVNQNGIVYEKDLGVNTSDVVRSIGVYDPGEGWEPVL